jgi:ABC-2 type transport system ATP-binding protein
MIKIQNLSKSYGQKEVLSGINAAFSRGKIYGVVGSNGAGKTTLFKCLGGLETYNGQIESDLGIIKNVLGYLPTIPELMSRITGWEYLKLVCMARGHKEDNFERENLFDLPLHQYAEFYSTGMKKKLAFHGILKQKNEIFILDEPFNGVDIQSNILLSEIIEELKKKKKYILIASHIFSTLMELCDEILVLKNGVIQKKVAREEFAALNRELKAQFIANQKERIIIE